KRLIKSDSGVSLRIGLPRETANDEHRISLTPGGVAALSLNNHKVYVESGAGEHARLSDHEYSEAGAQMVSEAPELYRKSEVILKGVPPSVEEEEWLQPNQVLICSHHLGNLREEFLKNLIAKGI